MTDFILREYRKDDLPALRRLWRDIFGDSEAFIDTFYAALPTVGTCAVCELDGRIVGMAHALTAMEYDGRRLCYLYAVAVESSVRRQGIGEAVVGKTVALARERGAELVCTLPANEGLTPWYERIIGTKYRLRRTYRETDSAPLLPVAPLSPAAYRARREELLKDTPHTVPSSGLTELTNALYQEYGGGFFSCGEGIACALPDGNCAVVLELIAPTGGEQDAASSVGAFLGKAKTGYYIPSETGDSFIASDTPLPADCRFAFTLE